MIHSGPTRITMIPGPCLFPPRLPFSLRDTCGIFRAGAEGPVGRRHELLSRNWRLDLGGLDIHLFQGSGLSLGIQPGSVAFA